METQFKKSSILKQETLFQKVIYQDIEFTIYKKTLEIFNIEKEQRQRCYVLILSKKIAKKQIEIIGRLFLEGKIISRSIAAPVDTCVIFVSGDKLTKLNRYIKTILPESEFKLIRLHKKNIPA